MATMHFPGDPGGQRQSSNKDSNEGQTQNTNFDNPQSGDSWNNYQTKELSSSGENEGNLSAADAAEVFEEEDNDA